MTKQTDANTTIQTLKENYAEFCRARNWREKANPQNVAISICLEAAELLEIFQWSTAVESAQSVQEDAYKMSKIREELADVLIYSLRMASALDLDIAEIIAEKFVRNAVKYPAVNS
jgi:NTP pyrophosphatase (non-canonical NTP hydrolase)